MRIERPSSRSVIPEDWPRRGLVGLVARHPVRQEAPGRSVPLRRKEVAPVLPYEPGAEKGCGFGTTRQCPEPGETADEEDREEDESQRKLVDPQAAEVDARTK